MTSHVYALIHDGVVENVIVATPAFVAEMTTDAVRIDHLTPTPGVGWTYSRRRFSPPAPRVDPFAGRFPDLHVPPAAHPPAALP